MKIKVGDRIKISLKNGFFYTLKVTEIDHEHIIGIDKFNSPVKILKSFIVSTFIMK